MIEFNNFHAIAEKVACVFFYKIACHPYIGYTFGCIILFLQFRYRILLLLLHLI
jgi:uncharacterized protein YpbB